MARNATWTNSDGLVVGFGTHTADYHVPGVYKGANGETTCVYEVNLADMPDTFAATNRAPQEVIIPRGSIVTGGYIQTLVAATSGGSATMDLGTWGTGDSVDDADGLKVDVAVAELANVGDVGILDGALIADADDSGLACAGATSNSDVVLAASYETAVFTAGRVRIIVKYVEPTGSAGDALAV